MVIILILDCVTYLCKYLSMKLVKGMEIMMPLNWLFYSPVFYLSKRKPGFNGIDFPQDRSSIKKLNI